MAEIARDYHNDLQVDDSEIDLAAKDRAIGEVLEGMDNLEEDPNMDILRKLVTEEDILQALQQSHTGTAAGIDGIPTELWKKLNELFLESERAPRGRDAPEQPSFDVIKVLTKVYNSIQKDGVIEGTQFA
ncbi:hypothetical protein C8R46DRAFT_843188, partial [Mycena filopes]